MQIPLPQPEIEDIYSLGFDKSLNRTISNVSSPTVYDAINEALNAGQVLSGGNLTLKTLNIGGLVRQVSPGDDIQAAIDAVNREGGGTVQLLAKTYKPTSNINLKSNVSLVGVGRDVTILDFNNAALGIKATGTSASKITSFRLENFTLQKAGAGGGDAGLDLQFCANFTGENLLITNCANFGARIVAANDFTFTNVETTLSGDDNWIFDANDIGGGQIYNFVFTNCHSWASTGGSGYHFIHTPDVPDVVSTQIYNFSFINCNVDTNGEYGYELVGESNYNAIARGTFINCFSDSNTSGAFKIAHVSHSTFIECIGGGTTAGKTFYISYTGTAGGNKFIGCHGLIDDTSAHSNIYSGQTSASTATFTAYPEFAVIQDTNDISAPEKRSMRYMKNTSGGSLVAGDVVVWKSVAAGNEVTTTTSAGDNKVFGMAIEAAANNARLRVLTEGKTALLKVDGTTDIAIGDFLTTFTSAGIAQKASAGQTVFAIALEAYITNDSNGVIDALLISPRLI